MMPAHVTDHAVRRYAERALHLHIDASLEDPAALLELCDRGVDVEAVRRRISDVCDLAADLGAVGVKVDGGRFVMRNGSPVTFLTKGCRPHYMYGDAA